MVQKNHSYTPKVTQKLVFYTLKRDNLAIIHHGDLYPQKFILSRFHYAFPNTTPFYNLINFTLQIDHLIISTILDWPQPG